MNLDDDLYLEIYSAIAHGVGLHATKDDCELATENVMAVLGNQRASGWISVDIEPEAKKAIYIITDDKFKHFAFASYLPYKDGYKWYIEPAWYAFNVAPAHYLNFSNLLPAPPEKSE